MGIYSSLPLAAQAACQIDLANRARQKNLSYGALGNPREHSLGVVHVSLVACADGRRPGPRTDGRNVNKEVARTIVSD